MLPICSFGFKYWTINMRGLRRVKGAPQPVELAPYFVGLEDVPMSGEAR